MRCSTIGCSREASAVLKWRDEFASDEPVCDECADSYERRPALRDLATVTR